MIFCQGAIVHVRRFLTHWRRVKLRGCVINVLLRGQICIAFNVLSLAGDGPTLMDCSDFDSLGTCLRSLSVRIFFHYHACYTTTCRHIELSATKHRQIGHTHRMAMGTEKHDTPFWRSFTTMHFPILTNFSLVTLSHSKLLPYDHVEVLSAQLNTWPHRFTICLCLTTHLCLRASD